MTMSNDKAMTEKYYLTTNTGETFEEMSLYELGRQLLTYDSANFDVNVEFTLIHKTLNGRWDEVGHETFLMNETDDKGEAEIMLVEKFADEFINHGMFEEWLNIDDSVRAYDEEGYKEELQWLKENNDDGTLAS